MFKSKITEQILEDLTKPIWVIKFETSNNDKENKMDKEGVRFRRFHLINDQGLYQKGSITAATFYNGINKEVGKHEWLVQFAYTSPKEQQENKKRGQAIAFHRLSSESRDRGPLYIYLDDKYNGLTATIKETILHESQRKNIRWMKNVELHQIV